MGTGLCHRLWQTLTSKEAHGDHGQQGCGSLSRPGPQEFEMQPDSEGPGHAPRREASVGLGFRQSFPAGLGLGWLFSVRECIED